MNRYYGDLVFCPNCRKIVTEDEILYKCETASDPEAHRRSMSKASGKSGSELSSAQGRMNYYFRRPPLRMFRKKNGEAICPVCRQRSSYMVCSQCFERLTTTAKRTEAISVVGFKGCGKTVYIGALINEIKKYCDVHHIDRTVEMVNEGNYRLQVGEKLPGGTPSGMIDPVRIHLGKRENGDDKYPLDLLIYDIAGEDLSKPDAPMELFHHLSMSSLIIYLFDSMAWKYHRYNEAAFGDEGRRELDDHLSRCDEAVNIENDRIIDLIIDQIRLNYMYDLQVSKLGWRKIPIYMAACVSSSDFLERHKDHDREREKMYSLSCRAIDLINPAACITAEAVGQLCEDPARRRKIEKWRSSGLYVASKPKTSDEKVVRQIVEWMQRDSEAAVKETLETWGEGGACLKIDDFREVSYFGVSSLGGAPTMSKDEWICPEGSPRNVINPLLWFFKKEGILELLTK